MLQIKFFSKLLFIVLLSNHSIAQTLMDPTRPAIKVNKNNANLDVQENSLITLNSIIQTNKNSYAVINNKIYHKGETIQGVKILRIAKDYVSLADGRKLILFTSVVKK